MDEIAKFIGDYKFVDAPEKKQNFFQIAGFPHYENVSSNVLKFFLSNKLILKSLLNCALIDFNIYDDSIHDVNREVLTENGNRIDIFVNTNKYIIGIENKINAGLDNPIDDYSNYLMDRAKKEVEQKFGAGLESEIISWM